MRSMSGWLVVVSNATRFGQVTVWEIHTEDGIDFIAVPAVADCYREKVQEALSKENVQTYHQGCSRSGNSTASSPTKRYRICWRARPYS